MIINFCQKCGNVARPTDRVKLLGGYHCILCQTCRNDWAEHFMRSSIFRMHQMAQVRSDWAMLHGSQEILEERFADLLELTFSLFLFDKKWVEDYHENSN